MNISALPSSSDYLVTFFSGTGYSTCLFSEIIKHKDDAGFGLSLGLPADFNFRSFLEGENGEYLIQTDSASLFTANIKENSKHKIANQDYIQFRHNQTGLTVQSLFSSTETLHLEHEKYPILPNQVITIGSSLSNSIQIYSPWISAEDHIIIKIDSRGKIIAEDTKKTVGMYVNGNLTGICQLKLMDEIFLMGLSIICLGDSLAIGGVRHRSRLPQKKSFQLKPIFPDHNKDYFVSAPRIVARFQNESVEIDAPPSPVKMEEMPASLTIGPSVTMSLVMIASLGVSVYSALNGGSTASVITSGAMAVGMLGCSLVWPTFLRRYRKKQAEAQEIYRKEKYKEYISQIDEELKFKASRTIRLYNDVLYPAPDELCSLLDNESRKAHLWERSSEDDDFLDIRLGLGNWPFDAEIKVPRSGFQLHDDVLRDLPQALKEKYGILRDMPLTLNIYSNQTIGIIGEQQSLLHTLDEIILNIVSLHSYDEVKIVFAVSINQKRHFEPYKNLPHVWSNDKKTRFYAVNTEEVHHIFNIMDEEFKEREIGGSRDNRIPHYILIVTDPVLVEKEALMRYMTNEENQIGLTTIFAYGDMASLPKSCRTIVQASETQSGYYIRNKNNNRFTSYKLDPLNPQKVQRFIHLLSIMPVKRKAKSLGMSEYISFLQMYKAGNIEALRIEEHWDNNNSDKSLAAPIGVTAGDELFSLDIHEAYHGCHGLVAGTTGSGKSEFLQAFILSLALNYSPKEVAFVLIDFKGGDMARPFMAKTFSPSLPHLAATISNLSENILYRALVSLEAEIKSRQRIFNEAASELGADKLDINSYHRYLKQGRLKDPLPHLVIIIDEFAQLKSQHGEFLSQLINIAQVGRSLGIHLILATQKPSGVVDPQIMSNSRFRICLKVADKQDSLDMINRPDSASIKNPGRMNLLVGYDEILETIQSGYSGAEYIPTPYYVSDDEITVHMIDDTANPSHSARMDLSGSRTYKSQLEAIVSELVALGLKKNLRAKPLWLNELPEKLYLKQFVKKVPSLFGCEIGLLDFVQTQEQKPLKIDFASFGHVGIYGASGSGKTTLLQTLVHSLISVQKYTPDEMNIYALDFGGRNFGYLKTLPHCGGVAFSDDEDQISWIVDTLLFILNDRKKEFSVAGSTTFTDYRQSYAGRMPAVLVLIDNYASFREKYMNVSDSLTEVIAQGASYGIYFVLTGSTKNAIHYRVRDYIPQVYALHMNDVSSYMDVLNKKPPIVPEEISGRGITIIGHSIVEFQVALPENGKTDRERLQSITSHYQQLNETWKGYRPISMSVASSSQVSKSQKSEELVSSYSGSQKTYKKKNRPQAVSEGDLHLTRSVSDQIPYGLKMDSEFKAGICANSLQDLISIYNNVFQAMGLSFRKQIILLDTENQSFRQLKENFPEIRYVQVPGQLDLLIEELKPVLNDRLEKNTEIMDSVILVFTEFNALFEVMTNEQAAFMRKVLRYINKPEYRFFFITGMNVSGNKSNDSLYLNLLVKADGYILSPNTYNEAATKIETLPAIDELSGSFSYLMSYGSDSVFWN